MITFEQIFNFDNLYRSHLRARCGKRHKREVVDFELNLFNNLTSLEKDLTSGLYKVRGYKRFMIYDPKEREIQALSYYDRIVQNCLCYNYMVPVFTKKLIYDNGACQVRKGTHFARKRFADFLREYYKRYGADGYILKLDVKKYFNNINHEILKSKLQNQIYDLKLKNLIFNIIDSFEYSKGRGLPMGNQTSQLFALYYLNDLDREIKNKFKIKYYVRYMDDLMIIHHDKKYLAEMFKYIKAYVQVYNKIELNEKSKIYAIKNGVEFLGVRYRLYPTGKVGMKMKNQSKKRMIQKVNLALIKFENKLLAKEDLEMSYAGFKGNTKMLTLSKSPRKYLRKMLKNTK